MTMQIIKNPKAPPFKSRQDSEKLIKELGRGTRGEPGMRNDNEASASSQTTTDGEKWFNAAEEDIIINFHKIKQLEF